ncbi:hypothetical protein LJC60_05610 [Ruminococcaceae bacterium OttesenSCG-928-D13]|nr:hypothetical protein [Ruminococcaceae bacterium OttesenSCG-928-D13]
MTQNYIVGTAADFDALNGHGIESVRFGLPSRQELYGGSFVIIPPHGRAGRMWARRVARELEGIAGRVVVFNLADLYSFLLAGEGVAELVDAFGPIVITEIEEAAQFALDMEGGNA